MTCPDCSSGDVETLRNEWRFCGRCRLSFLRNDAGDVVERLEHGEAPARANPFNPPRPSPQHLAVRSA